MEEDRLGEIRVSMEKARINSAYKVGYKEIRGMDQRLSTRSLIIHDAVVQTS